MPIRLLSPIVQPCSTTLWPMMQSAPMVIGNPRSVCSVRFPGFGAFAELDPFVVAAQHRAPPDARVLLQPHAADHDRGLGDPVGLSAGSSGACPSSS